MGKFKPAGSRKKAKAASNRGLVPCLLLLLTGFALVFLLMRAVLTSGK